MSKVTIIITCACPHPECGESQQQTIEADNYDSTDISCKFCGKDIAIIRVSC